MPTPLSLSLSLSAPAPSCSRHLAEDYPILRGFDGSPRVELRKMNDGSREGWRGRRRADAPGRAATLRIPAIWQNDSLLSRGTRELALARISCDHRDTPDVCCNFRANLPLGDSRKGVCLRGGGESA